MDKQEEEQAGSDPGFWKGGSTIIICARSAHAEF